MKNLNEFKKLKKYSKTLDSILKIVVHLYSFAILLVVLSLIGFSFMLLVDGHSISSDLFHRILSLENKITPEINFSNLTSVKVLVVSISTIVFIIVDLFIQRYIIKQIRVILSNVIIDLPFHDQNAYSIKSIGIFIIINALLSSILIFISSILVSYKPSFSFNFTNILFGILLIGLSAIFKYGSYLQEGYDETV